MPDFSFAKHDQLIDALVNSPSVWDSHSTNASEVKKIETHGSTVLLGIRKALKLKKPVLFDHMDYSTLAKRTACLNKEFQVNQPMAADLYEGVFSISFTADGIQLFPQPMKDAESCLLMKRFADGNRLDIYIRENEIPDLLSEQLCDTIVSFHKAATAVLEQESAPNFHSVISRNFDQLHEYSPTLFSKSLIEEFRTLLNTELSQTAHILLERLNKGWVRYGHGDLHLQNICLHNGSAIPFDAIEYEDDFVIGDVVYDTSFLLMDLAARGQTKTSNQLFNRYVR
ncbi:hypothetical protein [Sneathiella glossodoripedis]|uniref:hypothetical protein n=1 Tax=Sneathiella glossodoripedis TaxID=418853 RepID=UPI00046FF13F|nr:hypothetical protein [Sneathiella glossodoripedis]